MKRKILYSTLVFCLLLSGCSQNKVDIKQDLNSEEIVDEIEEKIENKKDDVISVDEFVSQSNILNEKELEYQKMNNEAIEMWNLQDETKHYFSIEEAENILNTNILYIDDIDFITIESVDYLGNLVIKYDGYKVFTNKMFHMNSLFFDYDGFDLRNEPYKNISDIDVYKDEDTYYWRDGQCVYGVIFDEKINDDIIEQLVNKSKGLNEIVDDRIDDKYLNMRDMVRTFGNKYDELLEDGYFNLEYSDSFEISNTYSYNITGIKEKNTVDSFELYGYIKPDVFEKGVNAFQYMRKIYFNDNLVDSDTIYTNEYGINLQNLLLNRIGAFDNYMIYYPLELEQEDNVFKGHGISYEGENKIEVNTEIGEDYVSFKCFVNGELSIDGTFRKIDKPSDEFLKYHKKVIEDKECFEKGDIVDYLKSVN